MFADLLLNKPIALPQGRARKVTGWDKVVRDHSQSPDAKRAAANNERVFTAIVGGDETANRIADQVGLSRGTVDRALRELVLAGRIHCVHHDRVNFYACTGVKPQCRSTPRNDGLQQRRQARRKALLAAMRQLGGRAVAAQLAGLLRISSNSALDWIREAAAEGDIVRDGKRGGQFRWMIAKRPGASA